MELLKSPNQSIRLMEISEVEKEENQGWTPDQLIQDFRLEEANIKANQRVDRFPTVLSTRDLDVGCTSVIKHTI